MIKTIFFDIGNVIVRNDHKKLWKALARNSDRSPYNIWKYYTKSGIGKSYERGDITPKQFYEDLKEEFNLRINEKEFHKIWCDIFTLNEDIVDLIKQLKKRYRLIILSNTDPVHHDFLKREYAIFKCFDNFVLSYKEKMRKPNPLIFGIALKKAKCLPYECSYIDDVRTYVKVSKLIGIRGVQYTNFRRLKKELKREGIL